MEVGTFVEPQPETDSYMSGRCSSSGKRSIWFNSSRKSANFFSSLFSLTNFFLEVDNLFFNIAESIIEVIYVITFSILFFYFLLLVSVVQWDKTF